MKIKLLSFVLSLALILCACGGEVANVSSQTESTLTEEMATRIMALESVYELSSKELKIVALHKFTDVKNTDSFNKIVQWGYDYNITENETTFRPTDAVTQKELCEFIFAFAVNVRNVSKSLYQSGIKYCEEIGITDCLDETAPLTVSQLETIVENFKSYIANLDNLTSADFKNITFDEENVVLSFAALSDIHFRSGNDTAAAERYERAVNNAKTLANGKLDAVIASGDLVQDFMYDEKVEEAKKQVLNFKEVTDKIIPQGTAFIFSTGNHDRTAKTSYEHVFNESFRKDEANINRYYSYDVKEDCEYELGNRHAVVNGYHFLSVGIYQNFTQYLKPILDKLSADDPLKPIFILHHYSPEYPTDDVLLFLNDYPQVVYFSGHTHESTTGELALMQDGFTMFSAASVREVEYLDEGDENDPIRQYKSEATLVQVDKNGNIRFLSYTNHDGSVIAERVILGPNKENTHLLCYPK